MNINITQESMNIKPKMSEDGIEREMHSELYNQDGIKKVLIINKDTQLNKSYKTPNQKSNNIINRAKEDAQKCDKPYPKIPT
jgi:hypothetical protein